MMRTTGIIHRYILLENRGCGGWRAWQERDITAYIPETLTPCGDRNFVIVAIVEDDLWGILPCAPFHQTWLTVICWGQLTVSPHATLDHCTPFIFYPPQVIH